MPRLLIAVVTLAGLAAQGATLGPEWTLQGQAATCGTGPRARTFNLKGEEKTVPAGMGLQAQVMTFGGQLAPVLEVCEGDRVTLTMTNARPSATRFL